MGCVVPASRMPCGVAWRSLILRANGRRGGLVWARPYEGGREEDRAAIERWARAEDADLENEAQKAKQKLRNVDRARE